MSMAILRIYMSNDAERRDEPLDPRVHFAAERTLLAWVRTGLALMGFGFVVARFGLFLRELAAVPGMPPRQHSGFSLWVGTTLVVLGVVINLAAAVKHWHTIRRLERGQPLRFHPWSLGMLVALLLGVLGLVMAFYLMVGLDQ
jgi:putative membrane protein